MKTTHILSAASFALILAGPACSAKFVQIGDEDGGTGVKCMYNGAEHAAGTNFKSADGCNTCTCASDGSVQCTLMACGVAVGGGSGVAGGASVGCLYNGVNYPVGASFKSTDGCNSCTCTKSGGVACTEMACGAGGAMGVGGSTGQSCTSCPGPVPAVANQKCWDGSVGGPVCQADASGVCAWTIRTCPPNPGSGGASGAGGSTGVTCLYNGVTYPAGASFKASDGCNSCSCTSAGLVACTKMACGVGGATGVGGSTGISMCSTAADCKGALPALCQVCADGSSGCAHFECNSGTCQVAYCGGVTCLYNGVTYPTGTTFKASDGCNVCSCSSDGKVACSLMACGVGGATGVGGSSGVTCSDLPLPLPDCGSTKPILLYDPNGCPKQYVCVTCPATNIAMPYCGANINAVATTDANGCVTGYVCPKCPAIDLAMPDCGANSKAVPVYDANGCLAKYACPSCDAITFVMPNCGDTKPVPVYSAAGCAIAYVCPACPDTTTQSSLPCATTYQAVTDPTTGCATSYSCN